MWSHVFLGHGVFSIEWHTVMGCTYFIDKLCHTMHIITSFIKSTALCYYDRQIKLRLNVNMKQYDERLCSVYSLQCVLRYWTYLQCNTILVDCRKGRGCIPLPSNQKLIWLFRHHLQQSLCHHPPPLSTAQFPGRGSLSRSFVVNIMPFW